MKTKIENPTDLWANNPQSYPCLVTKDGELALAVSPTDGVILRNWDNRPGTTLAVGGRSWSEVGWKPVAVPVTVTFTP